MHTATKACFFILAAAVTSMLSGVVALPSSELDSVPKTKEHAGVGVNLPKVIQLVCVQSKALTRVFQQRADPADVEWMKRDGEEIPSPTGRELDRPILEHVYI